MSGSFDLIVIGGGPGGYVCAIRAAQLGLKTAVIEREHLGGICLNWGCIPTKALLRTAEIYTTLAHLDEFGLAADNPRYDITAVVKRSRKVAAKLSAGIKFLLKKNKVQVIDGAAKLAGKGRVVVGKEEYQAKNIVLATGARAKTLPGLEPGKRIWTYKEAMIPDAMPKSLAIIGSGAIGIEFASFYRAFGCEVTVIEAMDRILPVEDTEISGLAAKALSARGMTLLTGATVDGVKCGKESAVVSVTAAGKKQSISAEYVISAIGITGNVEDIGLEEVGVRVEKGHVVVNQWMETGVPGLYAIGDVAGAPWLAHKASHEGILAAEKIAGVKKLHPLDVRNIPGCTYCQPQIASVGLTEAAAVKAGHGVRVGRFPFTGNGKAIALGETDGLIKTIFDKNSGELLGAHMIGADVTELIQGFSIARSLESTEEELIHAVFPHPTLSEMMHESVLSAYDRAIHI